MGEKVIEGEDSNGNKIESTWQVADVTKPLAGIKEMVKAKNRVIFDEDENGKCTSHIYNKKTKVTIPINDVNNAYEFDMWVKKTQQMKSQCDIKAVEISNTFQTLQEATFQGLVEAL